MELVPCPACGAFSPSDAPKCAECHAIWLPADEEHWQAWIRTTSRASWLSVFCPECAKREFGD